MSTAPRTVLLDPSRVEDMSSTQVLSAVVEMKRAEESAAAAKLLLACAWADQHPALEPGDEASLTIHGPDGGIHLPISGQGCPLVSEYAVAELGAVLGESTVAAKRLVGEALELRHRLPRLWALVQAGRVPAWRARVVAAETISVGLTVEAAAWVDSQVAAVVGKVGTAAVRRLVDAAILRFGLQPRPEAPAPERRRVDLDGHDPKTGTIHLDAVLSTVDGLDLDHALRHGAAELKALGSVDDLDTRRSQALGHLARHQTALRLHDQDNDATGSSDADVTLPTARELVLTLHFPASLEGTGLAVGPLGRLDQGQWLVLRDHVKAWASDSLTRISIRPVIDLNTELTAPGYAIPGRIRDHVTQRDGGACSRGAPNPRPGPTWTTSSPSTTTHTPRAGHSPARPPRPTLPRCADDTTASRPTRPGAS